MFITLDFELCACARSAVCEAANVFMLIDLFSGFILSTVSSVGK